jgi:hypothetical protein
MSSPEIEERDHLEACLGSIEDNLQSIGAHLKAATRIGAPFPQLP